MKKENNSDGPVWHDGAKGFTPLVLRCPEQQQSDTNIGACWVAITDCVADWAYLPHTQHRQFLLFLLLGQPLNAYNKAICCPSTSALKRHKGINQSKQSCPTALSKTEAHNCAWLLRLHHDWPIPINAAYRCPFTSSFRLFVAIFKNILCNSLI